MQEESRFQITYSNGKFHLTNQTLPKQEEAYLQDYLSQASRYKMIGTFNGEPVITLYQPPLTVPAGIRSLENRLSRKFRKARLPATATISVTKNCQCSCIHCSAVYYNTSHRPPMSFATLRSALSETVELGVTTIILLGGEPLLYKPIYELISSVSAQKAAVILFTNGEFLNSENCNRLREAGLMGAFVSLDSEIPEVHDSNRKKKGLFQKASEGLSNLKNSGLIAGISSYLSPQRLKENGFTKMMELGRSIGVHEVCFFDAIPTGEWLRDESCILSVEDRIEISSLTRQYRKKEGYPGIAVQSTMTSKGGSAFCFAANTQFYLSAFGDVCPCDFTPFSFGIYPEKSIRELWEKMIQTEPYKKRAKSCRMQDTEFRETYISKIPRDAEFPYPFEKVLNLSEDKNLLEFTQ